MNTGTVESKLKVVSQSSYFYTALAHPLSHLEDNRKVPTIKEAEILAKVYV